MSDRNRKTKLLSDAPVSEDAFEGGHERVANAIANLIRDEEAGRAIALRGPYGSGKSTTIRILEEEMRAIDKKEGSETRIFTYDAWEHQGDPLRRSFVESLIKFLRDQKAKYVWAEGNAWKEEKERLARRRETTTVNTEPKLTTWGRWVAVSLFLTPVGLLLLNNFLRNDSGEWQTSTPEVWFWAVGLFLVLLPLILVVAARCRDKDPFYVLVRKTHQEVQTKTIRTPDPTTIEFQKIFEQILHRTLRDNNRRLILVVDNLDRLPPAQALSAWATMRTFFERNHSSAEDWTNRFWLIVPFHFNALKVIFNEEATENSVVSSLNSDNDGQLVGGQSRRQRKV